MRQQASGPWQRASIRAFVRGLSEGEEEEEEEEEEGLAAEERKRKMCCGKK
jgi:hypothetical protein